MKGLQIALAGLIMVACSRTVSAQGMDPPEPEMKWLDGTPKTSATVAKGISISVSVDLKKVDTATVRISYWEQGKKFPANPQYTPKLDANGVFTGTIITTAGDTMFQIVVDAVDQTTNAKYRLSGEAKSRKE